MIDAVTGDTMGLLAFRRLVVYVSGCIAERTDGYCCKEVPLMEHGSKGWK
jgi:hypothetical protein